MIRRPAQHMPFLFTGEKLELACALERINGPGGRYAGERFHAVHSSVQAQLTQHIKVSLLSRIGG